MKAGKAGGWAGLTIDMIKALDELGDEMMFNLLKTIWEEENITNEWENLKVVPIYKQKGDSLDRGNYRGIKLL